jgi:hypothetical protein
MGAPAKLYKYQSYSSYALESLVQRQIWISKPSDYNDPFDCKINLENITTHEQLKVLEDASDELINQQFRDAGTSMRQKTNFINPDYLAQMNKEERERDVRIKRESVISSLTSVGVYSMTEDNDDMLMWAHYAEQHTGFVLGFDATNYKDEKYMTLMKVKYRNKYPVLTVDSVTGIDDLPCHLRTIALQKGMQWVEENEWRLVFPYPHCNKLINMPMTPVEMIFGHKMIDGHRKTLHSIMSTYYDGIKFFTAKPFASKYGIECLPYETE